MGASDVFHMLTSYPFEYSERSLPVSRLLLVDLPLRANCSSGQPLDSIQGAGQGRPLLRADGEIKYSVTSPGSSSLGNSYTASVRNVHAPPAAHHHFAEVGGAGGADRPYARPSSTLLVHSSHRELLRQRQRVAMLHFSGNPRVQPLNLGDGLLSAMLTVAETKLAFMQYLRQQAAEANRAGAWLSHVKLTWCDLCLYPDSFSSSFVLFCVDKLSQALRLRASSWRHSFPCREWRSKLRVCCSSAVFNVDSLRLCLCR